MWPRYGSTVNSAHSNTILENSVFETYGLLSMVPYDTGGRVAITIWGINPSFEKSKILYRRVDVSPTDVSPTENSWMLRPLNKASLGYCVPDRCVPTLDRVNHETSSVGRYCGLRHLMNQWGVWPASPTPLTRFIGLAPLRRMHARPTHRTPPLRSAKALGSWKSGVASLNPI
jgi:hypothetical protein